MQTIDHQNDQAAVASGVQKFVDSLATTIAQTMSVAAEKVAVEATIVRQQYRFEAMQSVLKMIHSQRDALLVDHGAANDATTKAIIEQQLLMIREQLQGILISAGVPALAAKAAAGQTVTLTPAIAGPKKSRRMLRAS